MHFEQSIVDVDDLNKTLSLVHRIDLLEFKMFQHE